MQNSPTRLIGRHGTASILLFLTLLLLVMAPSVSYAIPTWYNTGNYVVYDSQINWIMTTTVSDANTRWQLNMSWDASMPILVQPFYSNATLGIEMTQRVLNSATWAVTESQDLLVVVRTYLHEARSFNDTTVLGSFTHKGAVWSNDMDATYPDLFIGFDPVYLRSNSHFIIGNMTYVNLGIEDVETPWGIRPAYHLLGKGFDLNDQGQNMTWDRWCDTSSGVVLKSDLHEDAGTFGNLRYYERYEEILTIKQANFDVTKFEEEPWYDTSFYGLPLWVIFLLLAAVAVVYIIRRRMTKPIKF